MEKNVFTDESQDEATPDVIQCFEKKTSVKVPQYLKNLLIFSGYDNHLTIKNFNLNEDFDELENIARNTIPSIFKEEKSLKKYLGPFQSSPNCFFIVPGHKNLIKEVKKFAESYVPKRISSFSDHEQSGTKKKKISSGIETTATQKESAKFEEQQEPTKETVQNKRKTDISQHSKTAKDIQEDKSRLLQRIKFWIKNFLKELDLSAEQEQELSEKVETKTDILPNIASLEINSTLDSTSCFVSCFFCPKSVKIYKSRQRTWLISNIQKHIRTHSDNLKKKSKKSLYKSLLNFVTIDNQNISVNNSQSSTESNSMKAFTSNDQDLEQQNLEDSENRIICGTPVEQNSNSDIIILSDIRCNVQNEMNISDISESISNAFCSPNCAPQISPIEDSCNMTENTTQNFGTSSIIEGGDNICVTVLSPPSKWKEDKYSRAQRNIRLLERSGEHSSSNHLIIDYFDVIAKLENEITETFSRNPEIKKISLKCGEEFNCKLNEQNIPNFLKALQKNIINTKSHGHRYEKEFKNMCTYLYVIGGPLLYETLYLNLGGIPSVKTVKRIIQHEQIHEEGVFRFSDLKKFLIKRGYPLQVWISEDQTAITNRIEYLAKTNTVVGFVPHLDKDGLPEVNSFKFKTLNDLQQYFEKESKSTYINLIIAQPLVDKSPTFCLCVYGTANKFTSSDVQKRWTKIRNMARGEGISIAGFSTDGDTRMLKSMKENMNLPNSNSENESNWFFANQTLREPFYVQDTVHIGTKLKTAFLKPGILLPIGSYFISSKHIHRLIENVSKDKHCLTEYTLFPNDKMNFDSVEKITAPRVISELLQYDVQESKGTAIFLSMCRYILDSFLEKRLTPLERIYKMWVATFFFRIWRHHIKENKKFSITNNFISLNCYTCIEVNAHSIISYMKKCREDNEELFLPWLLSSQPCEENFRKLRSMTTTLSTVVNFSLLDVLRRLNRLNFMCEVARDTENYSFSRDQNRRLGDITTANKQKMPSDEEIEEEIRKAWLSASLLCISLKVPVSDVAKPSVNLILNENKEKIEEQPEDYEKEDKKEDLLQPNESQGESHDLAINISEEYLQDSTLNILSECYASQGTLNFKDYQSKREQLFSADSPYLRVELSSGKCVTTKKSSLCWLFQTDRKKLSNDRLVRVRGVKTKSQKKNRSDVLKEKHIQIGDWCAFTESNYVYLGQVIGFFIEETKKTVNQDMVNITNKNISCLATWYTINNQNVLEIANNKSYITVEHYKYTVPEPEWENSCYKLTSKLTDPIVHKLQETITVKKPLKRVTKSKNKSEILENKSSSDESSKK